MLEGPGNVERILARAMLEFQPGLIPRKPVIFAALHNGVAWPSA